VEGAGPTASPDEAEEVIVVDAADVPVGTMGKLAAHRDGVRHRAVSVVVYRSDGQVLLQQRAEGKYHSPGRWSNSCCGHPRPGETSLAAARRRLREELGMECALHHAATLEYRATVGAGLVEHEIDHVFVGRCDAEPEANPDEVGAWRWAPVAATLAEAEATPSRYTPWCALVLRAADAAESGESTVDRLAG
jgi:isopentenyl-diphosphate Delta-isomerase